MIASRADDARLPRVIWRRTGRRSMTLLTNFLAASPYGNPDARRKQIEEAVESLRHSPLRCPIAGVKRRLTFRKLRVGGQFVVYYVYTPPHGMAFAGTISIRAVKHAASQNPFWGVREQGANDQPLAVLSTRNSMEAAIA